MRVRELIRVAEFNCEFRIHDMQDLYTILRDRFGETRLPSRFADLIANITDYTDKYEELSLVGMTDGIPEIKITNTDLQDLCVLRITEDFIVYVGWEKNHK